MSRTIHTPPEQTLTFQKITFPGVKIAEFGRIDPTSGWIKFRCDLSVRNLETLFRHMGWQTPGNKSSLEKLDGKLKGGHVILTAKLDKEVKLNLKSKDRTVDTEAEIEIGFDHITDFQCHRLEIEGRKKKGFRRELRFQAKFHAETTAAEIESYQFKTDNSKGVLQVFYIDEPVQTEIETGDESRQSTLPESDEEFANAEV